VLRLRANSERKILQVGVRRIEDSHHPRGYRELRSPAEMRKLVNRKIVEQDRICAICHFDFRDYNDVVPDHENRKGIGGAWRDDHPSSDYPSRSFFSSAIARVVNDLPRLLFIGCVAYAAFGIVQSIFSPAPLHGERVRV
jgi:hypothetical protein